MHFNVDGNIVRGAHGRSFAAMSYAQAKLLASMLRDAYSLGLDHGRQEERTRWRCGWLRNKHSLWIGVHYSAFNKRWCINLIPCFTFWITKPGGKTP